MSKGSHWDAEWHGLVLHVQVLSDEPVRFSLVKVCATYLQAQIEAGKPMRTAWYRPAGSELSSGPSIASTGSTVNVPTKVS